ncbi:MAG: three-Cys-motif partner protein TcmP [Acidobacteriota bacterium]
MSEVGEWGETKYSLVAHYCEMFATGMKNRWDYRVYLDLFSGPGRVRFRRTRAIHNSTPMLALLASEPFDLYVFNDANCEWIDALKQRAGKAAPDARKLFFCGDADEIARDAIGGIEELRGSDSALTFCVLDPPDISSLSFATIRTISKVFVDFLVLIASGMDAQRNWRLYESPDNPTMDRFLGRSDWREEWEKPEVRRDGFGPFVMAAFTESMRHEDFSRGLLETVRLPENNTPLYYLAGFSRHPLGIKFWERVHRSLHPQRFLPLD